MKTLLADSGSTKTHWALVEEVPGLPKMIRTAQTQGLNPLYVTPEQITSACRQVLADVGEGPMGVDELRFYGSGCSGERLAMVERALRAAFTPMTKVIVDSDLMGAALALETKGEKKPTEPFIACIMGTGSIAALFDPATRALLPMPAASSRARRFWSTIWPTRAWTSPLPRPSRPSGAFLPTSRPGLAN